MKLEKIRIAFIGLFFLYTLFGFYFRPTISDAFVLSSIGFLVGFLFWLEFKFRKEDPVQNPNEDIQREIERLRLQRELILLDIDLKSVQMKSKRVENGQEKFIF